MSNINLSEQEQIRRTSLDELRKLGINPYPAAEYKTNVFAQEILDNYKPEENNFPDVCLAGRIMSRRIMGNASFAELMDSSGRIQTVSYTHLRAHETVLDLVCRLLLEKK